MFGVSSASGSRPSRCRMISLTMSSKNRRRLSSVTPATCGDRKTLGRSMMGESTGIGSGSKTSRQAMTSPSASRASRASLSTKGHRDQREDDVAVHDGGQRTERDAVSVSEVPGYEGVEGHDVGPEGLKQLGQPPGQVTETDHADPIAAELGPVITRAGPGPDTTGERGLVSDDPPEQRPGVPQPDEREGQRPLGGRPR